MVYYNVKKVLNNNVVIAVKDSKDYVLVGKAIGFDFSKNMEVPQDRVENLFIKQTLTAEENYNIILETIDSKIVGLSEEIINLCEKELQTRLNDAIHISLPDHINFAIRRIEKGVAIENPFLSELRALYPKEYALAVKALHMINHSVITQLPEDEAGFICLHIRAAISEQSVTEPLAYTKKIGEVMELICKLLKKEFSKNSLEYARTVTHINFMLERVLSGKTIKNYILDTIRSELYNEFDLAIKVAIKIEALFSVKLPEDEVGYLALHLKRLSEL
ncbi:PRD domain-containing protein [Clostridium omnivorum]|uniref:Transcription antiterminator BglG n=1 Tax=Clostridium omnivorum TaxID=1604902 RepID=A0ABQ5N824_9CLOT|nr:PRD domain-containing protein [Clostridium sp. E14]GLC31291.1 transcription antiterminator BglG [Clostridium sp. E14]